MRFASTLLIATFALAQNALVAYAAPPVKSSHSAAASHGCITVPQLSPKVPAIPASAPCPKALYTLTSEPSIKVDYSSPLEGTALRDALGIESSTFSLGYVDTKIGTGPLASPGKFYSIQYTGYLVDGTKFDSSLDRGSEPFVFQAGQHQVVPGWDTGFAGMRVGGKRRLFIPYQLAYGPAGRGPIPPKAELIFDLEFVAQSNTKPEPKPAPITPPAASMPGQPGGPPPPTQQPAMTPPASSAPASTKPQ
jgi:peptidylprolyl isomerase